MGMKQHPAFAGLQNKLNADRDEYLKRLEGTQTLPPRYIDSDGMAYTPEPEHQNYLFEPDGEAELDFATAVQEVADTNVALLLRKNRDYGPKNIAQAPGGALNGLRVRMHDKLARINNLLDSGVDPENESLFDSFMDLANYALIGQLVLRGEWPNE